MSASETPTNAPVDGELMVMDESPETGLAVLGTPDEMRAALAESNERQKIIIDYIREQLVEGVDYGIADDRSTKRTLLKPGAEKVCRLFSTRATWEKDHDTWEMMGKVPGMACYICRIIDNRTQRVVGEGRGADQIGNKQRDANKAIKNAEKCALVDAALYTFNLSAVFTQEDTNGGSIPHPTATLDQAKRVFQRDVMEFRKGCESSLTDVQFIIAVSESELHRKRIATMGELDHMRRVVLDEKRYDAATGDRTPAIAGKQSRGKQEDLWEHQ